MDVSALPHNLSAWREDALSLNFAGHHIAAWQYGCGPNLVLIHGFPTASWDWHQVLPALCEQFRVTCLDMLGFGFSAKPWPHDYSLMQQADLHQQLFLELGVGSFHILAHDYGDSVAQELLTRQLDSSGNNIQSICYLNGGLFPDDHRPRLIQRLLMGPLGPLIARLVTKRTLARNMRAIFGPKSQPDDSDLADFWVQINASNGRRVFPGLSQYRLERVQQIDRWLSAMRNTSVPQHLICGEADPISGRHMADRFSELVPQAGLTRLSRIGHYPQLEAPQEVTSAAIEFFGHAV